MIPKFLLIPLVVLLPMLALWCEEAPLMVQGGKGKEIQNTIGMPLVYVQPGKFLMGVPKEKRDDDGKDSSERTEAGRVDEDAHEVEITQGFYIGKYEVTQAEYAKVMGVNPSFFKGDKLPVEKVSWLDANEFCARLSRLEDKTYTLPSEAEWEYACRAGSKTAFLFGDTISADKANYDARKVFPQGRGVVGEFRNKTTPVGTFPANAWGLHDVHGNVWEWCEDWYSVGYYRVSPKADPKGPIVGKTRIARGGSWFYEPSCCRSAFRNGFPPETRNYNIGFRVVLRDRK